jgi:hypothetical protein
MSESSNDKPPIPPAASDEVVRSSGASGESYSPLLKNLLEETLKDAEREKEDLQARLRERDESAREEREADARKRREELQNRVQAEQKRRETLIREREQDGSEAPAEATPVAVQESSGSSAGVAGIVILLLVSAGLGYLVHRTMGERDGFMAERDALSASVTALHGEASRLTPDVKGGSSPSLEALENIGVRLKSLSGGMEAAVSEGARVRRESAERASEIEKLQAEVALIKAALQASEEALVAKPGNRPRRGPRKPAKASGAKKVKVGGGDIFGSDTR